MQDCPKNNTTIHILKVKIWQENVLHTKLPQIDSKYLSQCMEPKSNLKILN